MTNTDNVVEKYDGVWSPSLLRCLYSINTFVSIPFTWGWDHWRLNTHYSCSSYHLGLLPLATTVTLLQTTRNPVAKAIPSNPARLNSLHIIDLSPELIRATNTIFATYPCLFWMSWAGRWDKRSPEFCRLSLRSHVGVHTCGLRGRRVPSILKTELRRCVNGYPITYCQHGFTLRVLRRF